ncbi:FMN-binding negative transcriptional regulator [Streptomyces tuirus]|uniref:FMN-binding negative transcriptional regulator n=1 Tax=Streptomyces tuirus TaxID=68278 RepID=A0A941F8W2_9ACTN|nr:FMN-binding negative transcriptional regulator [Streptomyces tuirus]
MQDVRKRWHRPFARHLAIHRKGVKALFVPHDYREPDGTWAVDLARENPLAVLVTNGSADDGPYATHLPVIFQPSTEGDPEQLPGTTLLGHMNRANPHWRSLRDGMPVLVVFTGPHAYVSPSVYEESPAAPTWNFTSVHVHGTLRRIEPDRSADDTLDVITATVRAYESRFGRNWDMSDSIEYFRRIQPAVGAFRIDVTRAESMFKLSQEKDQETRKRVQHSFEQSNSRRHHEVAELMERLP